MKFLKGQSAQTTARVVKVTYIFNKKDILKILVIYFDSLRIFYLLRTNLNKKGKKVYVIRIDIR